MTREAPGTQGSAADPSDPRCFCAGPCRVGPLGPGPKLRNMPTRYRTPEALSRNLTCARVYVRRTPVHVKHDIHRSGPRTTISSLRFLPFFFFFIDRLPSPSREALRTTSRRRCPARGGEKKEGEKQQKFVEKSNRRVLSINIIDLIISQSPLFADRCTPGGKEKPAKKSVG